MAEQNRASNMVLAAQVNPATTSLVPPFDRKTGVAIEAYFHTLELVVEAHAWNGE